MRTDCLDYKAIGQRIKIARIKKGITQDNVAEKLEISNPHVSNIETGNTKMSLQILIAIANLLSVSVDELLCDNIVRVKDVFTNEISEVLKECTDSEMRVLTEILKGSVKALRKNLELDRQTE